MYWQIKRWRTQITHTQMCALYLSVHLFVNLFEREITHTNHTQIDESLYIQMNAWTKETYSHTKETYSHTKETYRSVNPEECMNKCTRYTHIKERDRKCVCVRERGSLCVWERGSLCVCERESMCVRERECVCVREREGPLCVRERVCVCVRERGPLCVWERERVCVCERECVCERQKVCVCEREREVPCVWERKCTRYTYINVCTQRPINEAVGLFCKRDLLTRL